MRQSLLGVYQTVEQLWRSLQQLVVKPFYTLEEGQCATQRKKCAHEDFRGSEHYFNALSLYSADFKQMPGVLVDSVDSVGGI